MTWNRNHLKFGLDVDDTLLWCAGFAIEKVNADKGLSLKEEDLTAWAMPGTDMDLMLPYFHDPEFVKEQPLLPGAQEFVCELLKRGEVFFVTAVPPEVVSVRIMRLRELFPEVPQENILIGTRKDVVAGLDVLLDDKAQNILDSSVKYPVLMRKPWNQEMSGVLAVNSYDEFLSFIDNILFLRENPITKEGNKVIALKKEFPDAVIAYVDRKRADMIHSLVERAVNGRLSAEETSKRILSFEQEKKNKSIADIVIDNTGELEKAVEEFRACLKYSQII